MSRAIIIPRGEEIPTVPEGLTLSSETDETPQPAIVGLLLEEMHSQVEALFDSLRRKVEALRVDCEDLVEGEIAEFKKRLLGVIDAIQESVNNSPVTWEVCEQGININALVADENLEALRKLETLMRIVERSSKAKVDSRGEIGRFDDEIENLGKTIEEILGGRQAYDLLKEESTRIDGIRETIARKKGKRDNQQDRHSALNTKINDLLRASEQDIEELFEQAKGLAEYLGDSHYLANKTELRQLLTTINQEEFAQHFEMARQIVEERERNTVRSGGEKAKNKGMLILVVALALIAGGFAFGIFDRNKEEKKDNKPVPTSSIKRSNNSFVMKKIPETGDPEEIKEIFVKNLSSVMKSFLAMNTSKGRPNLSKAVLNGGKSAFGQKQIVNGSEVRGDIYVTKYHEELIGIKPGVAQNGTTIVEVDRVAKIRVVFSGGLSGYKDSEVRVRVNYRKAGGR